MYKYLIASIIGVVTGFIAGFQGIAGSFYILTALLLTGIAKNQREAAGTTLLTIVFPLSIGAVYEYYKTGDVHWEAAAILIPCVFIASIFGAKLNKITHKKVTLFSVGVSTLVVSGYFFYKAYNTKW